ncbi:hypothetical protein [Clostridium sp. LIBA-8841]|uniref:hypothetical protein n=1 Tax=Clostridium sp. LIBA-8841 TaxID=2987530 RepID=UPI002AC7C91D|nr:hypothetical protein [Clostridium sp. LIBA-8841]MDZ5253840.1 hypothetical protein [Clostridium sp. LIBA-8841]
MSYEIISGKYETGTVEEQMGFAQLFGEESVQKKFDLYFHWYNIIHEIGHVLVDINNVDMDGVNEELFANSFAVAYWKKVDKKNNLNRVKEMIYHIIKDIPSPLTKESNFKEFFNKIWGTEIMNSVMMYGYFQLCCVLEAFNLDKNLSEVLQEVGYKEVSLSKMKPYSYDVNSENTEKVLENCLDNLKACGVTNLSKITLKLVDNPEMQCCNVV